ncbi:MAG TPA: low molecular weight protein-tyrosine-phosphatase [Acidimicrobiales bacterium]
MTSWHLGVICTGNICRSPMAEVVLRKLVADDPILVERVKISSAGTARWHVGAAMDPRAQAALTRAGFTEPGSPGAFADRAYLASLDLAIVMTREQREDIHDRFGDKLEVHLLRQYHDPPVELDVADPYYGDQHDFDACLESIRAAAPRVTLALRRRLDADSREV